MQQLGLVQRLETCSLSALDVPPSTMRLRTLVAVDEGILDNHRPAVCRRELLGLAPRLAEAACVLDVVVGANPARHAQHMARKKVVGSAEVGVRRVRVGVARGQEDFGRGDQQYLRRALSAMGALAHGNGRWCWCSAYVVLGWGALARECAPEESP